MLTVSASLALLQAAHAADGNELPGIGAIQNSTAGAGVASPQDSTWAMLNPAGMVELGKRLDLSMEVLFFTRGADPEGSVIAANPFAGHLEDRTPILIPSFGIVFPLESGAIGTGIFGIQGNSTDYKRPRSTLGYLGNGDRRAELQVAKIPISYAHQFDNGWSVGVSLLGLVSTFRTDTLTLRLRPTRGDWHYDYGLGIGFQASVYKRWERWAFGATYTSRQAMQQYGKYEDAIKWNLDWPQKLQVGVAFQATPKLQLLADYKIIHWSEINQLAKKTIQGGLGWDDQNVFKFGMNYRINGLWTVRAGYSHAKSAISDEFIFANALTPAVGEDTVAIGVSHALNDHSDIHVAYQHTFEVSREDNGKGDLFSKLGRGTKVNYEEDALIVQYSYKW